MSVSEIMELVVNEKEKERIRKQQAKIERNGSIYRARYG